MFTAKLPGSMEATEAITAGPTNGRKPRSPPRVPVSVARPAAMARSVVNWRAAVSSIRNPSRGCRVVTIGLLRIIRNCRIRGTIAPEARGRLGLLALPGLSVFRQPAEFIDFREALRGEAAGVGAIAAPVGKFPHGNGE